MGNGASGVPRRGARKASAACSRSARGSRPTTRSSFGTPPSLAGSGPRRARQRSSTRKPPSSTSRSQSFTYLAHSPLRRPAIAGRSFDFPVGANLRIQPRPDETVSFADLRGLADGYDLPRCVIETRKDQIAKLDWTIRPRDSKRSGADDPRLKAVGDFLTCPDREHDFET